MLAQTPTHPGRCWFCGDLANETGRTCNDHDPAILAAAFDEQDVPPRAIRIRDWAIAVGVVHPYRGELDPDNQRLVDHIVEMVEEADRGLV